MDKVEGLLAAAWGEVREQLDTAGGSGGGGGGRSWAELQAAWVGVAEAVRGQIRAERPGCEVDSRCVAAVCGPGVVPWAASSVPAL